MYQDAFEMANPLGSAKKKHKVLAVYLSVANLPAYVRSNTEHMSIVLCGEDVKQFGCAKLFAQMLDDLKDLEENGICINVVTAALYCITG